MRDGGIYGYLRVIYGYLEGCKQKKIEVEVKGLEFREQGYSA